MEVDDSPSSIDCYSRHGFIRSTDAASEGRVHLQGDRMAALVAVQASLGGGEGQAAGSAVVMNLMGRLLHDAGDLPGAANAYLKALEVLYAKAR